MIFVIPPRTLHLSTIQGYTRGRCFSGPSYQGAEGIHDASHLCCDIEYFKNDHFSIRVLNQLQDAGMPLLTSVVRVLLTFALRV